MLNPIDFLNTNTFGIKNWIIAIILLLVAWLIQKNNILLLVAWLIQKNKIKGKTKMVKDENYEEEEKVLCKKCSKDITDEDEQFCEECDDVFCDDCTIQFENLDTIICKSCVDEVYPREQQVVEKIVEKFVEVPKETIKVMGFSEPIL